MRHLYRVCAGVVLTLALSVPAFAGQSPCGGIADPLPPPAVSSDGETPTPGVSELLTELLIDIAGIVLPIF